MPWRLRTAISWHQSIGTFPFKLNYGRNVRLPAEAFALSPPSAASADQDPVSPDRVPAAAHASAQFHFNVRHAQMCMHDVQTETIC